MGILIITKKKRKRKEKKIKHAFSYFLLLFLYFTVFSLQCYRCVREDKPDALKYCEISTSASIGNNKIVNCSSGQDRCTIVKAILKDRTVTTFRRDCTTAGKCSEKCSSPDSKGSVVCRSCCEEDLCNKGEGPKASELSGTSRITITRGLYMLGAFLMWLVM